MSRRALVAALVIAVAGGCGDKKKQEKQAAPAPPPADAAPPPVVGPTAPLWQLAPPDAVAGVVVAPGALTKLAAAWDRARELAAGEPHVRQLFDAAGAGLDRLIGVDLTDPDARAASGIELARGAALFTDADGAPILLVAPWSSAAAMAAARGDAAVDAGPGLYRGLLGELVCGDAAGRVLCAPTADAISAAPAASSRPLSELAAARREALLGDVELLVDIERIGAFDQLRDRLSPALSPVGRLAAAVELAPGEAVLTAHLLGRPSPATADLLRSPTAIPAFAARDQVSATSARFRINPQRVAGQAAALGIDEALLAAFTGDIGLYGRGSGVLAGEILLGLADPARARAAIGPLCNGLLLPFGPIEKLDDDGCRVSLKPGPGLAASPFGEALADAVTGIPMTIGIDGSALVIAIGEPAAVASVGKAPAEPWQLVWRGRNLDPFTTADESVAVALDELIETMPEEARSAVDGARWLAGQLAEIAVGARMAGDGVHLQLSLAPFAGDPSPAFAAYREALQRLAAGDRAGYRSALAAAATAHPGSRLAEQAALVRGGSPTVGPGSLVVAVLVPTLVRLAREARAGRGPAGQR